MIRYFKGPYGINLLFRFHGSAVYKAWIPGCISIVLFYLYRNVKETTGDILEHTSSVSLLMAAASFLIVYRADKGYKRHWEGCGRVFHVMSKWSDAAVQCAAFHMQCDHYDEIKPTSFFDHPELLGMQLSRDRETKGNGEFANGIEDEGKERPIVELTSNPSHGRSLTRPGQLDGGWGSLLDDAGSASPSDGLLEESWAHGKTPSLFLQELAHLSSLAVAVAFCTLRNDTEGRPMPLETYVPGRKWPEADPDKDSSDFFQTAKKHAMYLLGMYRTDKRRGRDNAAAPMSVLGGVSEHERLALQNAMGASAKTNLAVMWLTEFVTRESVEGSTGIVAATIVSRVHQYLSDGMIHYNHARKIMYIPFPFPSAQINSIFTLVITFVVPLLMEDKTGSGIIGALLTYATVTCLIGLNEVGRDLENPFRNAPNDIPLRTLMAMHNESLISMCTGYHPDVYWDVPMDQDDDEVGDDMEDDELEATVERQGGRIEELNGILEKLLSGS